MSRSGDPGVVAEQSRSDHPSEPAAPSGGAFTRYTAYMTWRERSGESWLLAWLDDHGATSRKDVSKLLRKRAIRHELRDLLDEVPFGIPRNLDPLEPKLAAGAGIDLSGTLGCFGCLQNEFDTLFQRVGYYFDKILVVGPSAYNLARAYDDDRGRALSAIEHLSEFVLNVRRVGAEPYLIFGEKPPACQLHLRDHAEEAGLSGILGSEDALAKTLLTEAEVQAERRGDHWFCALNHPQLEHTVWQTVDAGPNATEVAMKHAVLVQTLRVYIAQLISDVRFAKMCKAPLGAGVSLHNKILEGGQSLGTSELDTAINIAFPFINGISAAEIIKIREQEGVSFERFRNALRSAITERVKAAAAGEDSASIASEILDDVVCPALLEIEAKLDSARRMLVRGSGLALGAGAVTTTVGLLASVPLVVGPIVSAVFAAPDFRTYLAQRREVELADMYFLWKMSSPKHGNH